MNSVTPVTDWMDGLWLQGSVVVDGYNHSEITQQDQLAPEITRRDSQLG
jgi:hypothetical protein